MSNPEYTKPQLRLDGYPIEFRVKCIKDIKKGQYGIWAKEGFEYNCRRRCKGEHWRKWDSGERRSDGSNPYSGYFKVEIISKSFAIYTQEEFYDHFEIISIL